MRGSRLAQEKIATGSRLARKEVEVGGKVAEEAAVDEVVAEAVVGAAEDAGVGDHAQRSVPTL